MILSVLTSYRGISICSSISKITNVYSLGIHRLEVNVAKSVNWRHRLIPSGSVKRREYSKSAAQKGGNEFRGYFRLLGIVALPIVCLFCWILYRNLKHKENDFKDMVISTDKRCSGNSGTLLKIGKYWVPYELFKDKDKVKDIKQFCVKDGDIIVASFPKSGTTWVQEIVRQIVNDSTELEKGTIEELFPYMEYVYPDLKSLAKAKSPRYMKTHLPYEMLPDAVCNGKGKIIYIARNAKDVSVSYYHFIKMLTITKYCGEFSDFFESFINGKVAYGPWTEHVLEYWEHRQQNNLLFITYEDLHKNPFAVIRHIASFLNKPLDDKKVLEVAFRSSFSQMQANPLVNYSWWDELGIRDKEQAQFLRKGKVGDWMNYYNEDMSNEMDQSCIEVVKKHHLNMKCEV